MAAASARFEDIPSKQSARRNAEKAFRSLLPSPSVPSDRREVSNGTPTESSLYQLRCCVTCDSSLAFHDVPAEGARTQLLLSGQPEKKNVYIGCVC